LGSVGTVDWAPEAKVRIARATKEISRRLEVDEETADRLWEAMSDVYELMAGQGLCAYPCGARHPRGAGVHPEQIRRYARSGGLMSGQVRTAWLLRPLQRRCDASATGFHAKQ
jgi:hypothetical protein